ncbi:Outer membrane efflux protein BepC precursor [compost metagenome]
MKSLKTAAATLALLMLAAPAGAETLDEASAATLKRHPLLAADTAAIEAAGENVAVARSGFFPSVGVNSELNVDNFQREVGSVGLVGRHVTLQASGMLFDGLATPGRLDGAQARHSGSRAERDVNANGLLLAVARAYLAVLRERAQLVAAKENLAQHERSVADLKQMVASDRGKRFDLVQIEARTVLARSVVTERTAALAAAEDVYLETVGQPAGALVMPPALGGTEFDSVQSALALGRERHPGLVAATLRQAEREADRTQANGALSPRLDAVGRYVKGADIQSLAGQNDEVYAGLRASYDLSTGLGAFAASRAAQAGVGQAASRVALAGRDMREAVRVAWAQREGLSATLPLALDHLARMRELLAGFRAQYTLGRRTMLDLLLIQNETYMAESRTIQLTHDRRAADYVLAAQVGTLLARQPAPAASPAPLVLPGTGGATSR